MHPRRYQDENYLWGLLNAGQGQQSRSGCLITTPGGGRRPAGETFRTMAKPKLDRVYLQQQQAGSQQAAGSDNDRA